jgi:aspartokinase
LTDALEEGFVVIVAGFQGVSLDKEITTLGRGGSDTTAVALAAALGADRCDLIKEVPGIFSSDPTVIPDSIPIPEMDYEHAKGISLGGARILKESCIDIAKQHGIELRVGNTNHQTKIKTYTQTPYISVALKENIIIYSFDDIVLMENIPETDEILILDGKTQIFHQADRHFEFSQEPKLIRTGYSMITAVGDNAGRMLNIIHDEDEVIDVIMQTYQGKTAKVIFKSEFSKEVLRRIHDKLVEII